MAEERGKASVLSGKNKSVFLSFHFADQHFAERIHYYLERQPGIDVFLYSRHKHSDGFSQQISKALANATFFVFFHGKEIGDYQALEATTWLAKHGKEKGCQRIVAELPRPATWPPELTIFSQDLDPLWTAPPTDGKHLQERHACDCAATLAASIDGKWIPHDGVPTGYIFDYEKDIITQFASDDGPSRELMSKGCPDKWPEVRRHKGRTSKSQLDQAEVGSFRKKDDTVLVDIRNKYHQRIDDSKPGHKAHCLIEKGLTFLEAGPREELLFGMQPRLTVGIVVSGGIAPGINAVIAGLVDRHITYWKKHSRVIRNEVEPGLVIHGYRDGFAGVLADRKRTVELQGEGADKTQNNAGLAYVMQNANSGGSMFGTSRYHTMSDRFQTEDRDSALHSVLNRLRSDQIDILYVIGGDGSMKAAHALHMLKEIEEEDRHPHPRHNLTVIGIPKTMDNDILWVWQSFGFMSAVEKAVECLRLLNTESISNPRLCVIQLFGSDSGFTVSHATLASLNCDAALIPEMPFNMEGLFQHIRLRLFARFQVLQQDRSPFGMIVMAETAVPEDWYQYVPWQEHLQRIKEEKEVFLARISDVDLGSKIRDCLEKQNIAIEMESDSHIEKGRSPGKGGGASFTIDLSREEVEAMISFVENGRRVHGETPDPLRTVSLRLVSQVLQHRIQEEMGNVHEYWRSFRVFTSEPRHLLRSSPPSANDIISGRRFGTLAVDNAMAGYNDFMISQWLTEYVLVPLSLVVLGRKRVPAPGIFWKSVLAKTEQGDMSQPVTGEDS